ncbi:MAG: energy transducer TonB [Gemmatimonadota bacterium]|nr:MAG: energy transducer TonB [Gemmatimonadota bacterium]
MKKLLIPGLIVATLAVVYAVAGERIGLGVLLGRFDSHQRLPALRSKELPIRYPAHLWRDGVVGEVVLRIHITELGTVDSVELRRSSGHAELDSIALEGAKRLEYHPARKAEEATAVWAELPVRFEREGARQSIEER